MPASKEACKPFPQETIKPLEKRCLKNLDQTGSPLLVKEIEIMKKLLLLSSFFAFHSSYAQETLRRVNVTTGDGKTISAIQYSSTLFLSKKNWKNLLV